MGSSLLHFLHRNVYGKNTEVPEVRLSLKEEKIQKARREYVKARDIAIKLHGKYMTEKGDFYRNKLNN
jgi:hypothetical protein